MARDWNEGGLRARGRPLCATEVDPRVLEEISRTMRDVVSRDARDNPVALAIPPHRGVEKPPAPPAPSLSAGRSSWEDEKAWFGPKEKK